MTDTTVPPSDPESGSGRVSSAARIAGAAVKGAMAGGGAGGAAANVARQATVDVVTSRRGRHVVRTVAMLVAVGVVAMMLLLEVPVGVGGSNGVGRVSGQRQDSLLVVTGAGVDGAAVNVITARADAVGVPWEIVVAILKSMSAVSGGVGPWHVTAAAGGGVPTDATDCPVHSEGVGAKDFCASTVWLVALLGRLVAGTPGLDRSMDLGHGARRDGSGRVVWDDEQDRDRRIVDPYASAVAKLPIVGASVSWAKGVVMQAILWHVGVGSDCAGLGESGVTVAPGSWTLPTIDADGRVGAGAGFGPRINPVTGGTEFHHGIDLENVEGTPIWAAAAGTVIFAGPAGTAGNMTRIDHGGGVVTVYMHQSAVEVHAGDRVAAGQEIGKMGSTGESTGSHLHFEVRVNGVATDPLVFMRQRGVDLMARSRDGVAGSPESGGSAEGLGAKNPSSLVSKTVSGQTIRLDSVQLKNAAFIIGVGESLKVDSRIIQAALMTALVESGLRQLASRAVPESMNYPNDGVDAGDHDSVGLFQQRALQGTWGTVAQIMDRNYTTRMFYGGPSKPKPDGPPGALDVVAAHPELINNLGALSQAVQVSAYPTRYAMMVPVAADIMKAVAGTLVPSSSAGCGANGGLSGTDFGGVFPTSDRFVGSTAHLTPTTLHGEQVIAAVFPEIKTIGGRRRYDQYPDHPSGKALDNMIPMDYRSPEGIAYGDRIAGFLTANAKALDVKYVIWRQHYWDPQQNRWTLMEDRGSDTANHMNHVHVTFNH